MQNMNDLVGETTLPDRRRRSATLARTLLYLDCLSHFGRNVIS